MEKGPTKKAAEKLISFENVPGSIYMGCFCCPEHWVQHDDQDASTLFKTPKGDDVLVNVIFRSKVFRSNRASSSKTGPTPRKPFYAALKAVNKALAETTWKFPSLPDCEATLAQAAVEP